MSDTASTKDAPNPGELLDDVLSAPPPEGDDG